MVIKHNDIIDNVLRYFKYGGGKTYYLGFNCLASLYSIKEGGVTDWTGYAGSGKTELLLENLMNCSQWYGHKHLINMPDAGSNEEVIAKLLHKISGKQFEEFYYTQKGEKRTIENRITEKEIYRYLPDVLEYFKIFNPKVASRSKAVTPREFWDFAVKNKKELDIFSAVIDSWNYMKHDIGNQRQDQWLEEILSYRNELAESSGLHLHTIIHPKTEQKNKDGKTVMPNMHSLKGGSEWSNNGKTIIVVHREFGSTITDVRVEKAKPRIVGLQGATCLRYDIKIGKFYEEHNGSIRYASKEIDEFSNAKPFEPINNDSLKPNTNFYETEKDEDEDLF